MVIVTRAQDIGFDEPLFVVACSASVRPDRLIEGDLVPLPFDPQGRARTGFRRPTYAIPAWLLKVRPSQLGRRIGHIPSDKLAAIIDRLPADPSAEMT